MTESGCLTVTDVKRLSYRSDPLALLTLVLMDLEIVTLAIMYYIKNSSLLPECGKVLLEIRYIGNIGLRPIIKRICKHIKLVADEYQKSVEK